MESTVQCMLLASLSFIIIYYNCIRVFSDDITNNSHATDNCGGEGRKGDEGIESGVDLGGYTCTHPLLILLKISAW